VSEVPTKGAYRRQMQRHDTRRSQGCEVSECEIFGIGRVERTFTGSRDPASGRVPGEAPFDRPGHLPDFEMRLLGVGFFGSAVLALPLWYLW